MTMIGILLLCLTIPFSSAFFHHCQSFKTRAIHKNTILSATTETTTAVAIEQITQKIIAGVNAKASEGKLPENLARMFVGFF